MEGLQRVEFDFSIFCEVSKTWKESFQITSRRDKRDEMNVGFANEFTEVEALGEKISGSSKQDIL